MYVPTLDDYNEAIKKKLQGLYLVGKNGVKEEVKVYFQNPEVEIQVKELPSIVIYQSNIVLDTSRWDNNIYYGNVKRNDSGVPISITEFRAPEPYTIFYTFRYYYEYMQDGTVIFHHILKRFPRITYIEVKGQKYDMFYEGGSNPNVGYKDFGALKKREFVNQVTYKLEALLSIDDIINYEKKLVLHKPIINVKKKE